MKSLPPPPTDPRLVRRALRLSVADGMLHAVMVGASESYLAALAVELGHGPTALALLLTVPLFAGALSQLLTVPLANLLGGRKRLVVASTVLQALTHVAFLAIAATRTTDLAPLLVAKTVFWAGGAVGVPAWNAWMATLTHHVRRQRYFAFRSGAVQATLFVAFCSAGWLLHRAELLGDPVDAFGALFTVALAARLASGVALALQHDPGAPSPLASGDPLAPVGHRFRLALRTSEWRVAVYVAVLMFGAQIAIPFFTPFMLRELALDYGTFAALSALAILTKAVTFPFCHRLAARFGLRPLLVVAGVGVAIIPTVWAAVPVLPALIAVQALSGVAWAGMDYASFQLLLSSARPECRMEFLSLAASLAGATQLVGAVAGGWALTQGAVAYDVVFWTSALARGAALLLLVWGAAAVRLPSRLQPLFMRLQGVRASGGAVRNPIVTDAADEEAPAEAPAADAADAAERAQAALPARPGAAAPGR